jgi:phosphoglycolate phosphatase
MSAASPNPLLVFDLDGTLAETAGDLVRSLNFIMDRVGLAPVSLAEGRQFVGQGARMMIQAGFRQAGRTVEGEELEELFHAFLAYYEANIAIESFLFPGVEPALERFAAAGWDLAVCTNKVEGASVRLLEALGIAKRFRAICGQDTFQVDGAKISKPDPRHVLMTIEKAGGDWRRALMIGDSRFDIEAAKSAKVRVIAVDFGYTDEPAALFGPDRVISHFDHLWSAVAELAPELLPKPGG